MHRAHQVYAAPLKEDVPGLLQKYGHIIERVARQISTRIGTPSLYDDLWSVGALGLIDSAGRFDSTRGVRFESFAEHRIRGSMIDELRRMDHLPRRLRASVDKVQKAKNDLTQTLGQTPTTVEIAEHMQMDVEEVDSALSLTQPALPLEEELLTHTSPNADEQISREQLQKTLASAVEALPERLRILMGLHYLEGLNYREIAKVLGVSEPRVCQLHAEAIGKLRESLHEHT